MRVIAMASDSLVDALYNLLCSDAVDTDLVKCMQLHGVVNPDEQSLLLADSKMNYGVIKDLQKQLSQLRVEHDTLRHEHDTLRNEHAALQKKHDALQKEHAALQTQYANLLDERQKDADKSETVRKALAKLAYEPFDSDRRGFELHRILYGTGCLQMSANDDWVPKGCHTSADTGFRSPW